jgi:hypothetical protein
MASECAHLVLLCGLSGERLMCQKRGPAAPVERDRLHVEVKMRARVSTISMMPIERIPNSRRCRSR